MQERVRKMMTGEEAPPTVATSLGFTMVHAEPGRGITEYVADGRHNNPMGTLHGGIICDISDAAMGMAIASGLQEGESFTSLDLHVHFFKPIWTGRIRADAKLVRATRSLLYLECEVTDEKGSLVAKLDSTCLKLEGEKAQGR